MKTFTTYYTSQKEFEIFLNSNKICDSKNMLIQIFSSITDEKEILFIRDNIVKILPSASLIGTTTDGEINSNIVTTNSVVVTITQFEFSSVKSSLVNAGDDSSYDYGKKITTKLVGNKTKVLIMFSDGLNTNGEELLLGIESIKPDDVLMSGGMAGDAGAFEKTLIFNESSHTSHGVCGVSIDSDVLTAFSRYSFYWQGIGKEMTVTKVEQNRVYTIDDISTVGIYEKYLGEEAAEALPAIGIEFPLIIKRDGVDVARAVLGKEDDGSLIFAGNLKLGDKVRFGYGNVDKILEDSIRLTHSISAKPIESIFIYSCMARRRYLLDQIVKEISPLSSLAPTSGFFTYGEFYKESKCELLNETMTILCMSEHSNREIQLYNEEKNLENYGSFNTQKALSNLITTTSEELDTLNSNLENIVKEKTEKLIETIEDLKLATRVKSDFLANMSHEIRTPMNAILGYVQVLQMLEKDEKKLKRIKVIKTAGDQLVSIINDILDFTKIESGSLKISIENFETIGPISEIIELFKVNAAEKSIIFNVDISKDIPKTMVGDSTRIKQIISNLLSNAIKFTPRSGNIQMRVLVENSMLKILVKDSGIGISQQKLENIFDAFNHTSTTRTSQSGVGLGLSICDNLVKLMNGKIEINSKLDEGSEFTVFLPLK
ncbi:MAG: ATP-binding protein [Campylobacterota bacterium]|nr:ATP-binding protein [Campylobacterota bacterium]